MGTPEQVEVRLGIISKVIEGVNALASIPGNMAIKRQLDELEGQLLEVRREYRKTLETNEKLEESLKFHGESYHRDNARWTKNEDGMEEGPFCSACWDSQHLMIHLTEKGSSGYFICNHCKTSDIPVLKEKIQATADRSRMAMIASQNGGYYPMKF